MFYYVIHWSGWLGVVEGVAISQEVAEGLKEQLEHTDVYPTDREILHGLPSGSPYYFTRQAQAQQNHLRTHVIVP